MTPARMMESNGMDLQELRTYDVHRETLNEKEKKKMAIPSTNRVSHLSVLWRTSLLGEILELCSVGGRFLYLGGGLR